MATELWIGAIVVSIAAILFFEPGVLPTRLLRINEASLTMDIPEDMACVPHDGTSAIAIPLTADSNNIFVSWVSIDEQWVKVAIDTGSESLVVASTDCTACDDEMKSIVSTGTGRKRTLTYGSQTDTVKWQQSKIMLRGWKMTCDPNDSDAILTHTDAPSYNPVCIVGISDVAVVVDRKGTSSYNILGLGRQTLAGPPSFLHTMFPDPPRAFTIYLHSLDNARLVLFKPSASCLEPKYKVPIHDMDVQSHHYYVRFTSLSTMERDIQTGVNRLLLDTGANAISLPRSIYKTLKDAEPTGTLRFTINDHLMVPFTIDVPYDMRDTNNHQILDAGHVNHVIVGCTFLIGYAIGVYEDSVERFVTIDTV